MTYKASGKTNETNSDDYQEKTLTPNKIKKIISEIITR